MQNGNTLISFENASFGYGKKIVLRDVNFSINKGDFFALLGPNGAGKTTIMKAILKEISPKQGNVIVKGGLDIGYVPQIDTEGSFWPLKVKDFVKLFQQKKCCEVSDVLDSLGIKNLGDRILQELSGGQRQRVQLAKALINHPRLLILDEPTDGMDISAEADYLDLLNGLSESGITVVLVSHHLYDVLSVARQILIVKDGQALLSTTDALINEPVLENIYKRPFHSGHIGSTPVIVPVKRGDDA